jgi:hypothetical protein
VAVDNGIEECFYSLYLVYKLKEEYLLSNEFLQKAAAHGNPFAIRDLSFKYMKGEYGFPMIFKGIYMYICDVPSLLRTGWKWGMGMP